MIFTLITILILLYSYKNFHKGLLLFLIYQIIWYPTKIGMFPSTVIIAIGMTLIYISNTKKYSYAKTSFPYKIPFLMIIISLMVTPFTAYAGFVTELFRSSSIICRTYVMVWLMWENIESKKDFNYLFKWMTFIFLILCLYGLIEYIMKGNPVLQYKVYLSKGDIKVYDIVSKRGYRVVSLFEHPIGAGMTFGLYFSFVLTLWIELDEKLPVKRMAIMVALMCLPCLLLTKMRSAILFTLICCLNLINYKNLKNKKLYQFFAVIVITLPFLVIVFKENLNIILSIFNDNYQESVGGSNAQMRFSQLAAVIEIMKLSPIGGLGETFKSLFSNSNTVAALDYESIWFEQMAMHGIIGFMATICLLYFSVIHIPMKYKSKAAFFFALAYWTTYSLSSVPSFKILLFYLCEIYFIKNSDVYKKTPCLRKRKINIKIG